MGRAPCCDKTKVKKGPWAPEEDAKLKSYIDKHGTGGNWITLPQKIGLKRCGKSCRLRWLNYLRPNIKHGGFSEEEDNIICSLYVNIGSRWSIIAAQLPGRTDNDIKNYWNTRLKKKLLGKQRKEQQAQNRRERDQEIKITNNNATNFQLIPPPHTDNINGFVVVNQLNPYSWVCELPAVLPVTSTTNYQQANAQLVLNNVDNHQASIKNMLIKLGGRFLDHNTANSMYTPPPMEDHIISSTPSDQFYQSSNLDHILTQLGPSDPTMFNAATDLEAELRELVYGNMSSTPSPPCHQLDGPAGNFYQMETPGTTSTSAQAAPESEISWGDINSLVYCATTTPMVSDYEQISCQQLQAGMRRQSDSAFAESIYFGLK